MATLGRCLQKRILYGHKRGDYSEIASGFDNCSWQTSMSHLGAWLRADSGPANPWCSLWICISNSYPGDIHGVTHWLRKGSPLEGSMAVVTRLTIPARHMISESCLVLKDEAAQFGWLHPPSLSKRCFTGSKAYWTAKSQEKARPQWEFASKKLSVKTGIVIYHLCSESSFEYIFKKGLSSPHREHYCLSVSSAFSTLFDHSAGH